MLSAKKLLTSQALLRGVFFCLLLSFSSCNKEKRETPDWPSASNTEQSPPSTAKSPQASIKLDGEETVLMVYNLRNYLSMPRGSADRKSVQPKPEHEIDALVENILRVSPHLLGVCEIGSTSDLKDLQRRLSQAGLDYPHSHFTSGSDHRRRLAILSQYPIHPQPEIDLSYQLGGKKHLMLRGILDVNVSLPTGSVRLLGVHLKSKRPSKYWDQALVRRHEAQVVRNHVESILKQSTDRLLVYGDFNDTKQSPTIRCIKGNQSRSTDLRAIDFRASDGSKWTHAWDYEDVYSRFDYVFSSRSMLKHVVSEKCYILDLKAEDPASDHRPLVLTFR